MALSSSPLTFRRLGIGSVAAASYGTMVYLTYQFMTANIEKNKDAIEENFGSSAATATVKYPQEGCNCYTAITDPKRTQTFDRIAEVYDEQISRDENVMLLPLLRRALIYFNAKGNLLEVGAGTGRNLDYYSSAKIEKVVLTDLSEQMLLQAREKVKVHKHKDKFQLFVADAVNMKKYYPADSFDTIVDTFGLCSFDDPVAVLKELQRVCKKDGKILLLEHGRSKSWEGLSNYLDKNAERHATNGGCVWNRDLDSILEEAGLEVDSLQTWHFGTTYYVVCKPSVEVKEEMSKSDDDNRSSIVDFVEAQSDEYASKKRFWDRWLRH